MRQCPRPTIPDDTAVVENFLKLSDGSTALSGGQVCVSAYIYMIEAGNIVDENKLPQLDSGSTLQGIESGSRFLIIER